MHRQTMFQRHLFDVIVAQFSARRDGPHSTTLQPVRQAMQIGRETIELAYRFQISIRTHRHIMGSVTYVNPGGLRVTSSPGSVDCNRRAHSFFSLRVRHRLSTLIPALLRGKMDPVRPGDDKVEESLHRGQLRGCRLDGSRHHVSDRQYRSHAFIRAQSTSTSGKSALACRNLILETECTRT